MNPVILNPMMENTRSWFHSYYRTNGYLNWRIRDHASLSHIQIAPWPPKAPGPLTNSSQQLKKPRHPRWLAVHVCPAAPAEPKQPQSVKMTLPQSSCSPARPSRFNGRSNFGSRASITQDHISYIQSHGNHPLQSLPLPLSDGYDKRYAPKDDANKLSSSKQCSPHKWQYKQS